MTHMRLLCNACTAIIIVAAAVLVAASPAQAAAPFQKTQSDGFYRLKLGDFEVTALLDGTSVFDAKFLKAEAMDLQRVLSKQFVQIDEIDGAVAGFVVNTGSKLILVDTGTGGFWGGKALGHLVANLKKAGYRPEQVDIVLLTHLHADHVGGLATSKGTRVFPRAVVHMAKADSDFWLSEKIAQQAPREAQEFFTLARSSAKPYIAAKKWSPFVGTDEIVPGVTPYPIAGHTPGHMGYLFTSKGQTMLVWGDLVHAAPVQMERPDVGVVFDIDGPTAIKTRQDLLADLAEKGTLVAGEHMPFPSLGRLRKEGAGFVWLPVPYKARP